MMTKQALAFFTVLLFSINLMGQNLVPNPGFETTNGVICGIMGAGEFTNTATEWVSPNAATPDLYFTNIDSDCYNYQPLSLYPGPIGIKGNQMPNGGSVMAGFNLFTIDGFNQRDYIQIQLTEPMVVGKNYEVSYYVSLGDFIEFSIDKIGIHFSTSPVSAPGSDPINASPQLLSNTELNNYEDWILVQTIFTADDNYEFMTIGNFNDDDNTTLISNPDASGDVGTYGAYYFFDDFSVVETEETAIRNVEDLGIKLFPNPVDDFLKLELPENVKSAQIKINNINGLQVLSQQFSNEESTRINTSNFSPGTYLISIEINGDVFVKRFVKI